MRIKNLGVSPEHFDTVADRIWRAWWRPDGRSLSDVEAALNDILHGNAGFPFTLVAVENERFMGTVTAIDHDIAGRGQYGPCVAALWVEPEARRTGIGTQLLLSALAHLSGLGFPKAYLGAKPALQTYYEARGWQIVERGIGADGLDAYVHPLAGSTPA